MSSFTDTTKVQDASHVEVAVDASSHQDAPTSADADTAADEVTQATQSLTLSPPAESNKEGSQDAGKSRPPTPPTRPDSPSAGCPARLQPLIPPPNFGAVTDHKVFRSAFPQERNLDFLHLLGVKSMLCFVETDPSEGYNEFVSEKNVSRFRIDISPNKEGKVKTSTDSICEALLTVLDAANYPLYIHCNQGRHRTGCVIACLRKVQGWPIEAIIAEYEAYASPKARPGDIEFIKNVFEPQSLLEYAKKQGQFDHRPSLMSLLHQDMLDVEKLVRVLESTDGVAASNASLKSDVSKPDSGVDLSGATLDPSLLSQVGGKVDPREAEISVEECGPMSPPVRENEANGYLG